MTKPYISPKIKQLVFQRAKGYCEYCKCPSDFSTEPFSIEHIHPRSKEGINEESNLAWACIGCNILKSNKTEFIDPLTQVTQLIFHPRQMKWSEHFIWDEKFLQIIGISPIGRATIEALKLNRQPVKNLRRALFSIGEHPPL